MPRHLETPTDPPRMESVLAEVIEGREHLILALDGIEARRDARDDADLLRSIVGDLAAMVSRWERERARWVA